MQTAAAIEERKETPQQALSANSQMQAAPQEKERIKLEKEKIQEINTRVISLMEKEELYKEAELTLQDLSTKIQHPTYQVSLAINEGLNKSFYDLVNGYRVEEAKRLLLMPDSRNYTILSVGFEAGFNSKTTFNTVFKKFTGLTPTEYKSKIAATV
jgi:YesN/AraC family two-component response regulator